MRRFQADHEKPKAVKWRETFIDKKIPVNYQMKSLVRLLHYIARKYLDKCTVMILYDSSILQEDSALLQELLAGNIHSTTLLNGSLYCICNEVPENTMLVLAFFNVILSTMFHCLYFISFIVIIGVMKCRG